MDRVARGLEVLLFSSRAAGGAGPHGELGVELVRRERHAWSLQEEDDPERIIRWSFGPDNPVLLFLFLTLKHVSLMVLIRAFALLQKLWKKLGMLPLTWRNSTNFGVSK